MCKKNSKTRVDEEKLNLHIQREPENSGIGRRLLDPSYEFKMSYMYMRDINCTV